MMDALYWLVGIEPEEGAEGGTWSLQWLNAPRAGDTAFLIILGCLAMAVLFWWLYRKETGQLTGKARYLLLSLRILLTAIVVIMLLKPALVLSRIEERPSELLVLVDTSQSMGLSDAWVDPQQASDAVRVTGLDSAADLAKTTRIELTQKLLSSELIEQLKKNGERNLHIHRFDERLGGSELSLADQENAFKLGGRSTAIGEAIQQLLQAYQGKDLAGVVLFTDGQNTTPSAASLRATAQIASDTGIAIFPIGVGTPQGPRNAQVTKLEGSDVVFVNDQSKLTAVVSARGLEDEPATLVLERLIAGIENPTDEDWQQVDSKDIVLAADATPRRFEFALLPTEKEIIIYRARLEEVEGEIDPDDNAAIKQVNVVYDKTRVLFIAGYTFPEVQFIRNALIRDSTVEVSTWLQTASKDFKHAGNDPIRRLPVDLVELAGGTKNGQVFPGYDAIVLYDPTPAKWPAGFSDLLKRFVTERGGGLVYIAGERYTQQMFNRSTEPAASYMSLLPVVREPGLFRTATQMELSRARPWKLQITDAGWRDPVFAFDKDATTNRKILDQLPGMMWHMPVSRAKPGATVLARHAHPGMTVDVGGRQEQEVLMATQLVGPGRVLWIGFDSTYRWRFAGENVFDGFWQRVIDRAGLMKQLGGQHPYRVSTDKQRYEPGDEVVLTAKFIDPGQVDDGLLSLYAQIQTGQDDPIELTMTPAGDGLSFETRFEAERAGDYLVRVWPGDTPAQRAARPNTHGFTVAVPDFETRNPTLAGDELSNLALTSGGTFFTLDQADLLPEALTVGLVDNELIHSDEVWNAPLLILIFLGAILAEWIIRKRCRLV
ncbi:MAG: VWA domain-containing protein [Phycisphaeraceae bacterium]|nr:VWA domain-containing protein [Phycisphaeraceae bacterium]